MKNSVNQNHHLVIQILSPVHVGAGKEKEWSKGIDYIYDDKNRLVYFINQEKLLHLIYEKTGNLDFYFSAISSGQIIKFHDYLFKTLKISYDDLSDMPPLPYDYAPDAEIKTCIRTALGEPYIPGSSIKGAIRSILFSYLLNQETSLRDLWKIDEENIKTLIDEGKDVKRKITEAEKDIQEKVFGKIEKNLMRLVRVTDAIFQETELIPAKTFNLHNKTGISWEGWWKHGLGRGNNKEDFEPEGFVFPFEIYKIGSHAQVRIGFADEILQFINSKDAKAKPKFADKVINKNSITGLFKIINDYTLKFINKEIAFFSQYKNEQTNAILAYWYALRDEIDTSQTPSGAVLRMSSGSGFYGITGDWRLPNHLDSVDNDDPLFSGKKYKSRRLGFRAIDDDEYQFMPFGFVRLVAENKFKDYLEWKVAFDKRYSEYLNNPPKETQAPERQKVDTNKNVTNEPKSQVKPTAPPHEPKTIHKTDLDKNPNQLFECLVIENKKVQIFVEGLLSQESQLVIPKYVNYQPTIGDFIQVSAKQFNKERTKITQVEFVKKI